MQGGLNVPNHGRIICLSGLRGSICFFPILLLLVHVRIVVAAVPLSDALETEGTSLVWATVGTPAWSGQTLVAHDGVDAAQSGAVSDNASVTLQTALTGPGVLTFWWKVSSETNKDTLKFFINGVQQLRISGEMDWSQQTFQLPAGSQVLKWTYSKNASVSVGQDAGWVDQVRYVPDDNCVYAIAPENRTHSSDTVTGTVSVVTLSNCGWSVTNTNDWITIISNTTGFGSTNVTYVVAPNSALQERVGYLQIAGQGFAITQQAFSCSFSLSPASRAHGTGLETGTVMVTTAPGCEWNISNTNAWVSLMADTNGTGSGLVTYVVSSNPGERLRTGIVTIANQAFTINQFAEQSTNTLVSLSEALDTVGFPFNWSVVGSSTWVGQSLVTHDGVDAAQSGPVPDAGAITLQTTLTGPGILNFWWKVSSEPNKDGLKFFINGVQQVRITGEMDWKLQSYNLSAGTQVLKWTYSKDLSGAAGWDRGWVDEVRFIPDGGCLFALSASGADYGPGAGSGTLHLTASSLCGWSVANTNAWVTITSSVHNIGNADVVYNVDPNPGQAPRSGFLIVADQAFAIQQSAPAQAPKINVVSISAARGVTLSVQGQAGRTNVIEYSLDLVTWAPISTNVMPQTPCPPCPYVAVTDAGSQGVPQRFYRAIQLP